MRNLHATLILSLFQVASVLSTKDNAGASTTAPSVVSFTEENSTALLQDAAIDVPSSSTETNTNPIIPLVLICLKWDYFIRPSEVVKVRWIGDDKLLGGSTEFTTSLENYPEDFSTKNESINKKQIYLCAMGGFKKKYGANYPKPRHDQYCTYWTTFEPTELLKCKFEPVPFVEKINVSRYPSMEEKDLPCGFENRGKMYRFAYKICMTSFPIANANVLISNFTTLSVYKIKLRDSFEVYRFCYDEKNNEVMYTKHDVTSVRLLFNDNLINERKKTYQMMSDGYIYFKEHYQKMAQDYIELERIQENLKTKGDFTEMTYQTQKLTPDEDMEFALWRKTTFHYLNVRPMESQQAALWNEINLRIRNNAINMINGPNYAYQTAVLTLDENRDKPPIMGKITSPDIWLKVVNDKYPHLIPGTTNKFAYDGIAIIMNTNYGNPATDAFFRDICEKNWCKKSLLGMFSKKVVNTVGCCPVTSKILAFFNSTLIIRNRLEIYELFDEEADTTDTLNFNVSVKRKQRPAETEEEGPSEKS